MGKIIEKGTVIVRTCDAIFPNSTKIHKEGYIFEQVVDNEFPKYSVRHGYISKGGWRFATCQEKWWFNTFNITNIKDIPFEIESDFKFIDVWGDIITVEKFINDKIICIKTDIDNNVRTYNVDIHVLLGRLAIIKSYKPYTPYNEEKLKYFLSKFKNTTNKIRAIKDEKITTIESGQGYKTPNLITKKIRKGKITNASGLVGNPIKSFRVTGKIRSNALVGRAITS